MTEIYLISSCLLFGIGLTVVITKKNLIFMLMGIELMLNAVNLNFIFFSKYDINPAQGHLFAIFIMIIAACEVAIALAIILKIKANYQSIDPDKLNELKN